MTEVSSSGDGLDAIIARNRWLLLDFDGPICSIFSGLPAPTVADQLRKLLTEQDVPMPEDVAQSPDPMEVFAYAGTVSPEVAALVEAELADQEVAAVATAKPTPYVHDVLAACRESGRAAAIVSNNSERAVQTYLVRHGLDDRIGPVFARTRHDPALLKPSPHLIEKAVHALHADPAATALVGDSITDIEGSRLASIDSIGYANKPEKCEHMKTAGAGAVITTLADLALRLRARRTP
jgi:beta-phosphoglucomutase-like phosphatase (HAD superfamily)